MTGDGRSYIVKQTYCSFYLFVNYLLLSSKLLGLQSFLLICCFFGFRNKQPMLHFDIPASTPDAPWLTWLPPAWSNICQRYQRSFLVVLLARIVVTMEYSSGRPFGNISLQKHEKRCSQILCEC